MLYTMDKSLPKILHVSCLKVHDDGTNKTWIKDTVMYSAVIV